MSASQALRASPRARTALKEWSSWRRLLQNSTRHFRELMSLYYCTSSQQAALATCVSQSGRSHALLTRHTTADCTKISPGVVAVLRAWAEGPQRRRRRKRHRLCDPWAYGAGPNRWCAALAHLLAPVGGTLRRARPAVQQGGGPGRRCWCRRATRRSVRTGKRQAVRCSVHGHCLRRTLLRPSSRWRASGCSAGGVQRKPSSRADSRF